MENKPKISAVEIILLVFFCVLADIIAMIPLVNMIVTFVMAPLLNLYLWLKGISAIRALVGSVIKFIPILSILPAYTASIALTIYVDRHPKSLAAGAVRAASKIKNPRGALSQVKN